MPKDATEARSYTKQSDLPKTTLESALRVPRALQDQLGGRPATPMQLATALEQSPTSSAFRDVLGAAVGYGLTTGGVNAASIGLTELGRRAVAPTEEGADARALVEAALTPSVAKKFFQERYRDGQKFPEERIAKNVLTSEMAVATERVESALQMLKANAVFVGILKQIKGGLFVSVAEARGPVPAPKVDDATEDEESSPEEELPKPAVLTPVPTVPDLDGQKVKRVFITHGRNKKILDLVKQLVTYAQYEAIVAEEHESTAKPVPDKVLDSMRSCQAAVIHVGVERILKDDDGKEYPQINENVLIEIGAAMALYRRRFILLVEEGVKLPSNLQGLYECRYTGTELSMEAGMKLLKQLKEFE